MSKLRKVLALAAIGFGFQAIAPSSSAAQAQAAFYEHVGGGASFVLTDDSAFVGWDWNDRISEVHVLEGTTVRLYEHANFEGEHLDLSAGTHALPSRPGPGGDGTWNDAVSSIQIDAVVYQPSRIVLTVNGSFNPHTLPWWMQYGSPMHAAMTATYGEVPEKFHWRDSRFPDVLAPVYDGIHSGAALLAQHIDGLPQGIDLSIVAHSHGGNVAIEASHYTQRSIRRIVQLGTPVNWDLTRVSSSRVQTRCQVYSTHDTTQIVGASPTLVFAIAGESYDAAYYAYMATQELFYGNYATSAYFSALSIASYGAAINLIDQTRREDYRPGWSGVHVNFDAIPGNGSAHEKLHEPWVWNYVVYYCGLP